MRNSKITRVLGCIIIKYSDPDQKGLTSNEFPFCVLVDSNLDDGSESESAAGRGVGDGGWGRRVEVGFLVLSRKG